MPVLSSSPGVLSVFDLVVLVLVVLQAVYAIGVFRGFFSIEKSSVDEKEKPQALSVVVCARNEAENLKKNIPLWLSQDHPNFEWIVVNDRSFDESRDLLEAAALADPRIRMVDLKETDRFWFGKNFALTLGIKAAKHDRLVLTDADCLPESTDWLRRLDRALREPVELLLGYGPYRISRSWISWLSAFDALFTAIHYSSWSALGKPYMGVGRNMAYRRELFMKNKGFSSHMDVISSDDDLFVSRVAHAENHRVLLDPQSLVYSEAPETLQAWLHQKKRHLLAAPRYRLIHRYALGFWGLSTLLLYLLIPVVIVAGASVAMYSLLARTLFFWGMTYFAGKRLGTPRPALVLPLAEPFIAMSQAYLLLANRFGPKLKYW